MKLHETIWNYVKLHKNNVNQPETTLNYLKLPETILNYVELHETTWNYSPISFDLTLIFHISKGLSFPPPSPPFDRVNAIISYFPFFLIILLYLYNIHKI